MSNTETTYCSTDCASESVPYYFPSALSQTTAAFNVDYYTTYGSKSVWVEPPDPKVVAKQKLNQKIETKMKEMGY